MLEYLPETFLVVYLKLSIALYQDQIQQQVSFLPYKGERVVAVVTFWIRRNTLQYGVCHHQHGHQSQNLRLEIDVGKVALISLIKHTEHSIRVLTLDGRNFIIHANPWSVNVPSPMPARPIPLHHFLRDPPTLNPVLCKLN